LIQSSLGGQYKVRIDDDALPNAVEYLVLYSSVLFYGAADATLTLILHNLGREARLMERQMFEYWTRASYFANNPAEAKRKFLATPFEERAMLDDLNYDKSRDRYKSVSRQCNEVLEKFPNAWPYREPSIREMLGPKEDARVTSFYALHYRVPSQTGHGTAAGVGNVWDEAGVRFDSREKNPNQSLETSTLYILGFLDVLNEHLDIDVSKELDSLRLEFSSIQAKFSTFRES
jgi:hypothetical protein